MYSHTLPSSHGIINCPLRYECCFPIFNYNALFVWDYFCRVSQFLVHCCDKTAQPKPTWMRKGLTWLICPGCSPLLKRSQGRNSSHREKLGTHAACWLPAHGQPAVCSHTQSRALSWNGTVRIQGRPFHCPSNQDNPHVYTHRPG